jgi:hypothetical protein
LRNIIAVGRNVLSEAEKTGTSTGKPPASRTPCFTLLSEVTQMRVARGEIRPGVENADDRTTIEHVMGVALVLHPSPVIDLVAARFRRTIPAT